MANYFGPRRPLTSTEIAAQRILRMMEQEELEEAELRRLQDTNWRAPGAAVATPFADEAAFGDGRDALADLVQREIDERNALQTEARHRTAMRSKLLPAHDDMPILAKVPGGGPGMPNVPKKQSSQGLADSAREEVEEWADRRRHYLGVPAATSEAVGSQLPGRENGPADAYRHILWAAELTRRFGESRAREIFEQHETHGRLKGDSADAGAMDQHNNEIGIQLGIGARNWDDVVSAARKLMSGSAADGSSSWQSNYDPATTLARQGAIWLPENRWGRNPVQEPHPDRQPFWQRTRDDDARNKLVWKSTASIGTGLGPRFGSRRIPLSIRHLAARHGTSRHDHGGSQ